MNCWQLAAATYWFSFQESTETPSITIGTDAAGDGRLDVMGRLNGAKTVVPVVALVFSSNATVCSFQWN